eukprot:15160595-Alexandrium_andersonii.AAC.1
MFLCSSPDVACQSQTAEGKPCEQRGPRPKARSRLHVGIALSSASASRIPTNAYSRRCKRLQQFAAVCCAAYPGGGAATAPLDTPKSASGARRRRFLE